MVQGDGQLDHAEAGAEVAAGDGDGVDGLGAQLVRQLFQLRNVEAPGVGGEIDLIEKRGVGHAAFVPKPSVYQHAVAHFAAERIDGT